MTRIKSMKQMTIIGCLLWGSCSGQGSAQRIEVSQANDLGIVALEIERSTAPNGDVFELLALDANDSEVASVRLLTGTISDLPNLLSGSGTLGSEIVLALEGVPLRLVTRQTHSLQI